METIAICICTRNRKDGLINLLESINSMNVNPKTYIKVIVVENDKENSCEKIINEFKNRAKFEVRYFHESKQGISTARNKSVIEAEDSDFCCFVDDDQIVDNNWLIELMRCQKEFDADAVSGINPPIFNYKVPNYIREFHLPKVLPYGTICESAATNCLLIKKSKLDKIKGPFDTRLDVSGGEDVLMTSQVTKIGGIIIKNPAAIAYEIIPRSRATISYLLKRMFRDSNTLYLIKSLQDKNINYFKWTFKLITKLGYGVVILIPYLVFSSSKRLKGLLKITESVGGLSFILGYKNSFYRSPNELTNFII